MKRSGFVSLERTAAIILLRCLGVTRSKTQYPPCCPWLSRVFPSNSYVTGNVSCPPLQDQSFGRTLLAVAKQRLGHLEPLDSGRSKEHALRVIIGRQCGPRLAGHLVNCLNKLQADLTGMATPKPARHDRPHGCCWHGIFGSGPYMRRGSANSCPQTPSSSSLNRT